MPHPGLGACLVHILPNGDEQPIAYASRTLISAEKTMLKLHVRHQQSYLQYVAFISMCMGDHLL